MAPRTLRAAFFLVLAAASFAAHAALPAGVTQVATVEGITEYRLGNGLRVVLFPDAGSPSASLNVTYLVGSRHEKLRRDRAWRTCSSTWCSRARKTSATSGTR